MLTADIERFVEARRAAGFRFAGPAWLLRSYGRFAEARGDQLVKSESVIAWAALTPHPGQRVRRLLTVRLLARFLRAEDSRHEVPPEGVFCAPTSRKPPYILSDREILRLIAAARELNPRESIRPWAYATLFGLLATTGMRISEALALRSTDVTVDGLVVRETKFRKSRLLPLAESTWTVLHDYLARRARVVCEDDHVFISLKRRRLSYYAVWETFRDLCQTAKIPEREGMVEPVRLHDIRHTYAVKALKACPDDRDRATQHMLALTTYMGHARISSTYWYLEATPELLDDIASAAASVIHRSAT